MNRELPNRKRNRMRWYDYSEDGWYFITICTKNRIEWLGKIKNDGMVLNDNGKIAKMCWLDIPNHYPNMYFDEWIIMPNHIHGIIVIENDIVPAIPIPTPVGTGFKPVPTNVKPVPTETEPVPTNTKTNPKSHGLSEIIRGFKTFSSRKINKLPDHDHKFQWQRSFYDHIIRNEKSLHNIREYIINNPIKWALDRNNPGDLYM